MPVKTLSDTDKLNYFLNDNGENGGGAYIAAAYSKFIEWQNSILQPIITANQLGGILYNYLDFVETENYYSLVDFETIYQNQFLL